MIYRSLGRIGIHVSVACLGTMTFGWEPEDWGSHENEAVEIVDQALDLGVNFFDTADVYARGQSEKILGKALKNKRDGVILATKCHGKMDDDDPNAWGNSRRHILEACDASLKRLKTDWIDLYQIHRPQPKIPIDETLRALDDLIRSGKVRAVGCSTFAGWQACEAHYVAKNLGINGFVTEQPPYNLLDRRVERELLPFCRTYDWGVIPWSPLAGGILSGKYLEGAPHSGRYAKSDPASRVKQAPKQKLIRLKNLADRNEMSMTSLSLAWVSNQPGVTSPIVGARNLNQLKESIGACQIKLSDRILRQIDDIFEPGSHYVDYYRADFGPNSHPV